MRKFIFMLVAAFISIATVNAQVAREVQSKVFDNVSVSVQGGVSTPLDLDGVFPLNAMAGLRVSKDFTPVFGVEAEGNVWFGDNHFNRVNEYFTPIVKTFVKATNVGLNGKVNLTNLFFRYKGSPRMFETKAVAGLGWLHYWNKYKAPQGSDVDGVIPEVAEFDKNGLTAKAGLQFAFTPDKARKHTFFVEPAVFWNLSRAASSKVQFNQKYAQLALVAGYTYHFKTSNGTHYFKTYDVGAMNDEINNLREELAKKPTEIIRDHVVEKVVYRDAAVKETIFFAFDSDELDANAKETLDKVGQNGVYNVYGYASSEGSTEYNKALSQRRAETVAAYLRDRGARVDVVEGRGVQFGTTTGRVAIVEAAK